MIPIKIHVTLLQTRKAISLAVPPHFQMVRALEQGVRQQAEIAAAAAWPVAPPLPHRRHRDFKQAGALAKKWKPRRGRHAIQIMMDRHDAGTVTIAGLAQLLVCPQRPRSDRVAGGAVAVYGGAAEGLQQGFRADNALAG